MPFHVTALWISHGRAFGFNWSEDDVKARVVAPYEAARPVVVQGQQFDPRQARFQIVEAPEVPLRSQPTRELWEAVRKEGQDVTDRFLVRAPGDTPLPDSQEAEPQAVDPRTVMVVYGRDQNRTAAIFALLRALNLKPLEWGQLVAETGEGSPYIGEVLRRAFTIAQAAVVLFTPDDEARLAERLCDERTEEWERELVGQARPNVFFEAGMAFGRFPARTVMVEIGVQRTASDLAGRLAVRLDNSAERRNALAERLAQAGCPVDRRGDGWLSAGDFE